MEKTLNDFIANERRKPFSEVFLQYSGGELRSLERLYEHFRVNRPAEWSFPARRPSYSLFHRMTYYEIKQPSNDAFLNNVLKLRPLELVVSLRNRTPLIDNTRNDKLRNQWVSQIRL